MSIGTRIPRSAFGSVLMLADNRPVFTADYYSVDGATGKVAAFIDWNNPMHLLAQASGALQVAVPAAHADFANKLCATFTGAEYYVSSKPPAYWDSIIFPGSEAVCTHTRTGGSNYYLWSTRNNTNGAAMLVFASGVVQAIASGGGLSFSQSPAAGSTQNVPTYIRTNHVFPRAQIFFKSTQAFSGTTPVVAQTSLSDGALNFGRRLDNTAHFVGRFRNLLFPPIMGAAEIVALQDWIQADTGIAP